MKSSVSFYVLITMKYIEKKKIKDSFPKLESKKLIYLHYMKKLNYFAHNLY